MHPGVVKWIEAQWGGQSCPQPPFSHETARGTRSKVAETTRFGPLKIRDLRELFLERRLFGCYPFPKTRLKPAAAKIGCPTVSAEPH
jgi:hypothetical protein